MLKWLQDPLNSPDLYLLILGSALLLVLFCAYAGGSERKFSSLSAKPEKALAHVAVGATSGQA